MSKRVRKKRTVFCDIDGTIFKYRQFDKIKTTPPELTSGALQAVKKWKRDGCVIIFTTARPEELRNHTVKELLLNDIPWDKLIMGIGRGPRYLVNDMDPAEKRLRAVAYSIERDKGLKDVIIGDTEEIIK